MGRTIDILSGHSPFPKGRLGGVLEGGTEYSSCHPRKLPPTHTCFLCKKRGSRSTGRSGYWNITVTLPVQQHRPNPLLRGARFGELVLARTGGVFGGGGTHTQSPNKFKSNLYLLTVSILL